jgi:hypothetical protein
MGENVCYKCNINTRSGSSRWCKECHYLSQERLYYENPIEHQIKKDLAHIKGRHKEKYKNDVCDLTYNFLLPLYEKGCTLTGIQFEYHRKAHPYCPSVDRIDPMKGYTRNNIQVILLCLNELKSELQPTDFFDMVLQLQGNKLSEIPTYKYVQSYSEINRVGQNIKNFVNKNYPTGLTELMLRYIQNLKTNEDKKICNCVKLNCDCGSLSKIKKKLIKLGYINEQNEIIWNPDKPIHKECSKCKKELELHENFRPRKDRAKIDKREELSIDLKMNKEFLQNHIKTECKYCTCSAAIIYKNDAVVSNLYSNALGGSKKKNVECLLTKNDVKMLVERTELKCEIFGNQLFNNNCAWNKPSLDQIKSRQNQYKPDNIRLTSVAVNAALKDFDFHHPGIDKVELLKKAVFQINVSDPVG